MKILSVSSNFFVIRSFMKLISPIAVGWEDLLVHTEKGTTCSDNGFQDLSTDQECSDAVNYAKSFNDYARYISSGSWTVHHKGCVIFEDGSDGRMYFNRHSIGTKSRPDTQSICKKGNY